MNTLWKILKLECIISDNGLSNVVYRVHWLYAVTSIINEKKYVSTSNGILPIAAPTPENFVAFNELTKQQVVNWVIDILGEENIQTMTTELTNANTLKANPVTITLHPPFSN